VIKKTAKQIAQAIAQEPVEILKTAGRQIEGVVETPKEEPKPPEQKPVDQRKLQNQSARQIAALEAEIRDIHTQRQQKEREAKQQEVAPPPVLEAPPQITSKPQRGRLRGMKQKIKDLTNRTETRKQSSG